MDKKMNYLSWKMFVSIIPNKVQNLENQTIIPIFAKWIHWVIVCILMDQACIHALSVEEIYKFFVLG